MAGTDSVCIGLERQLGTGMLFILTRPMCQLCYLDAVLLVCKLSRNHKQVPILTHWQHVLNCRLERMSCSLANHLLSLVDGFLFGPDCSMLNALQGASKMLKQLVSCEFVTDSVMPMRWRFVPGDRSAIRRSPAGGSQVLWADDVSCLLQMC